MKLPAWFSNTKKAATPAATAELAAKLLEAEEAHRAALGRVDVAREQLAADRNESAAQALRAAKGEVEDLLEMRAILQADHAEAARRDAEAELARLNAEADAMELDLAPGQIDSEEQELFGQEMAAWSRLFDVRVRRKAHCAGHDDRRAAYLRLCDQLGRGPSATRNHGGVELPVREAMKEMAQRATGYRQRLIEHLARIPSLENL